MSALATEAASAIKGELSHRITMPDLAVDTRGLFDRYSADFDAAMGAAVVANNARITVTLADVKDILGSLPGATVRVYDPEQLDDSDAYLEFKAGEPRQFENVSVEIDLEQA